MRRVVFLSLVAFTVLPLAVMLGLSSAWGDEGDDALMTIEAGNYSRALQLAQPAADRGNLLAQFTIGRIYEEGMAPDLFGNLGGYPLVPRASKSVPKNPAAAKKWFQKTLRQAQPAAAKGDANAQFILGVLCERGWGTKENKAQAAVWYRKAAEQGYPRAQVALGWMYNNGMGLAKNEKESCAWFRKAAEQGFAEGQRSLGTCYDFGGGVEKDKTAAVDWYLKAAEQGNDGAKGALFFIQDTNKNRADAWLRKAAEHGDDYVQLNLGWRYANGDMNARDESKAVYWYGKAAAQGDVVAQRLLCATYSDAIFSRDHNTLKIPVGFKLDQPASGPGGLTEEAAIHWCNEAAYGGDALAQYELGRGYEYGLGVGRDESEAAKWYQKAADQEFVPKGREHNPGDLWDDARSTRYQRRKQQGLAELAAISATESHKDQVPTPRTIQSEVDKPGYTTPENINNFAVVIGVEKYASLPVAEFAERDADAVRAHLTAMGYPTRNVYFLSGQQATRAKIAQSVNTWLPKRVDENSTVFFYYSGHGAPDPKTGQAYLVPVDGDAEDLDSTAYPIRQLYSKLGSLKAQHVIVALDSCFSGAGGRSVIAKGTRPLVSTVDLGGVPDNLIALTASDKTEISGTIEDQGHGAFTYYMLKGLAGAAKTDSGHVTVQSLYKYLTPKVQDAARLHNRDQTPQLLPTGVSRADAQIQLR